MHRPSAQLQVRARDKLNRPASRTPPLDLPNGRTHVNTTPRAPLERPE
jgi:hypothetical protein